MIFDDDVVSQPGIGDPRSRSNLTAFADDGLAFDGNVQDK